MQVLLRVQQNASGRIQDRAKWERNADTFTQPRPAKLTAVLENVLLRLLVLIGIPVEFVIIGRILEHVNMETLVVSVTRMMLF